MFLKTVIVIATIIVSVECGQTYIINGTNWKNELEKCASGGDETRTIKFNIGTLGSIPELKYNDVSTSTIVNAHGFLELLTSTGSEVNPQLHLTDYEDEDSFKSFSQTWRRATTSGFASQTVAITLTLKIYTEGPIELISEMYAYSMLAVSCAHANATVNTIEIIN